MVSGGTYLSHSESYKYQIINKYLYGKIYRDEAAKLLDVSLRTVSRYARKIKESGVFGAKHGNCGNSHNLKYPEALRFKIVALKKVKYFDFNTTHFHSILEKELGIEIPYIVLWRWLKQEKLVKNTRKRRRKKHMIRQRMPQEGLILQMDGCHHKFNGKDVWCLVSCIDDATSEIPYAEFFEGETTLSCMKVLKRIIETKGVPKAIYTDRAGWAGGSKRTEFSQFKRACEKLGIQIIFANSPEAKGRIERSFRTVQDRLVPELRLHKIKTMDKANEYLHDTFLKEYWNKEKTVPAMSSESAYEPMSPWLKLDEILCLIEERKIGSDHTVSYQSQRYLIKPDQCSYAGYMASFRINLMGELKVFVMDNEVQIEPVPTRQYDKNEVVKFQITDKLMYRYMNKLASDLYGAVWDHKVTGKPLKLPKKRKSKAS